MTSLITQIIQFLFRLFDIINNNEYKNMIKVIGKIIGNDVIICFSLMIIFMIFLLSLGYIIKFIKFCFCISILIISISVMFVLI